jgi:rubrerythrin
MECACEQTESLRGAAVNAYLTRFLERVEDMADPTQGIYQCRICGTRWLRRSKDAQHPAELVRLLKDAMIQENE